MTAHDDTGTSDTDRDVLRSRLLDAALGHVAFDGWTPAVLNAAARELGVDHALAQNAFRGGAAEVIDFWNQRSDRQMLAALGIRVFAPLPLRDRAAFAVRLRLEAPGTREAVRGARRSTLTSSAKERADG